MPDLWDTPADMWDTPGDTWSDTALEVPTFKPRRHMASNELPKSINKLISLAEDCADGANQHEASLPLETNLESVIRGDLSALVAAKAAYAAFDTVLPGVPDADAVVQTNRSNAKAFILLVRGVMEPVLGGKGTAWVPLGWPASSLAIPSTSDKILPHLLQIKAFLTANATYEITTPTTVMTAAKAQTLHTALDNAVKARNTRDANKKLAFEERNKKETQMRKRLRALIGELELKLDPLDTRWLNFGLNRPGAEDPPEAPENITAAPMPGGKVLVQCDRVPRTDYYQYYKQVVGVDPDPVLVLSWDEPEKILDGFTAGTTVKFLVRAVNEADAGPFGEGVDVVIT